jgi:hypothetical protein
MTGWGQGLLIRGSSFHARAQLVRGRKVEG